MEFTTRFLFFCANADPELLEHSSVLDRNKYMAIGILVLLTSIFAWTAGTYAVQIALEDVPISVFFGLLWGAFVFNLDRLIIGSINLNDEPAKKFFSFFFRAVIAIIVSIAISHVLALRILEKEINTVLGKENRETIQEQQNAKIEASEKLAAFDDRKLEALQKAQQPIMEAQKERDKVHVWIPGVFPARASSRTCHRSSRHRHKCSDRTTRCRRDRA